MCDKIRNTTFLYVNVGPVLPVQPNNPRAQYTSEAQPENRIMILSINVLLLSQTHALTHTNARARTQGYRLGAKQTICHQHISSLIISMKNSVNQMEQYQKEVRMNIWPNIIVII